MLSAQCLRGSPWRYHGNVSLKNWRRSGCRGRKPGFERSGAGAAGRSRRDLICVRGPDAVHAVPLAPVEAEAQRRLAALSGDQKVQIVTTAPAAPMRRGPAGHRPFRRGAGRAAEPEDRPPSDAAGGPEQVSGVARNCRHRLGQGAWGIDADLEPCGGAGAAGAAGRAAGRRYLWPLAAADAGPDRPAPPAATAR